MALKVLGERFTVRALIDQLVVLARKGRKLLRSDVNEAICVHKRLTSRFIDGPRSGPFAATACSAAHSYDMGTWPIDLCGPFSKPPWQEKGSRGRRPIRCPCSISLPRMSFFDQPTDRTHAANERQAVVSAIKNWTSKTKTRNALAQSVTGWILRVLQRS